MTVEFISVGTEILLGNIVNTNAAYLSEKCAALGLSCYYQSVVGDNEERLDLRRMTLPKRWWRRFSAGSFMRIVTRERGLKRTSNGYTVTR